VTPAMRIIETMQGRIHRMGRRRVESVASSWCAVTQQLPRLLAPMPITIFCWRRHRRWEGAQKGAPGMPVATALASVPLARRSMPACVLRRRRRRRQQLPPNGTMPATSSSGARPHRRTHRHARTARSTKDALVGWQGRCRFPLRGGRAGGQIMCTCVIGRVGMLHFVKLALTHLLYATFGRIYIEVANIYIQYNEQPCP
jgi:hypothetical protein